MSSRQSKVISELGTHFDASSDLLKKAQQQTAKKIQDKQFDTISKREAVRSSLLESTRNKSASLADCKCKRINNVEEGITKSTSKMEKTRHSFFTQTLKSNGKSSSALHESRKDFLTHSRSLRSTVNYNLSNLRSKQEHMNAERLNKHSKIAEQFRLKKKIQV
jgi:hypothetical protein